MRERTIDELKAELEEAREGAHEDSPYVRRLEGLIVQRKCEEAGSA